MWREKNGRIMLVSKSRCKACDSKKSTFIQVQEANGLLSSLGIKTPLVGPLLFYKYWTS